MRGFVQQRQGSAIQPGGAGAVLRADAVVRTAVTAGTAAMGVGRARGGHACVSATVMMVVLGAVL